jgi:hypothetical protein
MLQTIKENHNKRILNLILHGKINAGRAIKKYNVLTEGKTNGSLSKLLKMLMTKMGCI